jgi:hypothetical protein
MGLSSILGCLRHSLEYACSLVRFAVRAGFDIIFRIEVTTKAPFCILMCCTCISNKSRVVSVRVLVFNCDTHFRGYGKGKCYFTCVVVYRVIIIASSKSRPFTYTRSEPDIQVRIIRHFDLLIYTDLDYLLLRWNYFWHIVHVLRLRMQNGRFIFRSTKIKIGGKPLYLLLKVRNWLVWFSRKRSPARTVHFSLNSSMKILSNWSALRVAAIL